MFYQLGFFSEIGDAILQALRTFVGYIAAALYGYIVDLYKVFMIIARTDVLDHDYVQRIYARVGMILGLFMLFKLSFTLIQSLIDPDKFTDKKNGFSNIIVRCVVAIVLLGTTPAIFKLSRNFQNVIVGTESDTGNVLYRLIVADDIVSVSPSEFGRKLSSDLFFGFFRERSDVHFSGDVIVQEHDGGKRFVYENYATITEWVGDGKMDFKEVVPYLTLRDNGKYVFEWDYILSVGAAIAVIWILVNYCISIAIRVIQLAYLQLIAPIPILSYVGNPDGAFKKWIKQCTSTYLDLFMRLAILYFIITIASKALELFEDGAFGLDESSNGFVLVKVFILIGLLMFGKRVPELLKELFPGDGKFDLGIKSPKKLLGEIPGGGLAKGAAVGAGLGVIGAGVSGISRFRSNRANGKSIAGSLLGGAYGVGAGLFKGTKSGFTKKGVSGGWKNIQDSNNKYNQLITSGGSTLGTVRAKVGDVFGESKGQKFTREMANYQKIIDDNKYVNDVAEELSVVKQLKTRWETLRMSGASEMDIDAAWKTYKSAKKKALEAALKGEKDFGIDEYYTEVLDAGTANERVVSKVRVGVKKKIDSFEDATYASQILARANSTKDFAESHNVKLEIKDSSGNVIRSVAAADIIKDTDSFKEASVIASNLQTKILSENDFGAAIANDAAAGVDSNRTARKDRKN